MTTTSSKSDRPRVLMVVLNAFRHDTRVEKQAKALLDSGCAVDVLALRLAELPAVEHRDGMRIIRVDPRRGVLRALVIVLLRGHRWPRAVLSVWMRRPEVVPGAAGETPGAWSGRGIVAWIRPLLLLIGGLLILARRATVRTGRWIVAWMPWVAVLLGRSRRLARRTVRTFRRRVQKLLGRSRRLARRTVRTFWRRVQKWLPQGIRSVAQDDLMIGLAKTLDPDLLIAHDANALLVAIWMRRFAGVPFVYDSHEIFLERNISGHAEGLERLIWKGIERTGVREAEACYSVSDAVCERLQSRYGRPFRLLPNSQAFEGVPAPTGCLRDAIGTDGKGVALYTGRISRGRGLQLMLEAAAMSPDIHWVVMGPGREGPYADELEDEAARRGLGNFHVLPPVPSASVGLWLADADVAVVPSDSSSASYALGLGNKSFHALAAGLPQVMSDQPGKRAFAEETGAALLFNVGDAADLSRQVERIIGDADLRRTLIEAAVAAARRHDWNRHARDYAASMLEIATVAP
jgi:glycosyltransferase involved in cell wall biosynthesis